MNCLIIPQALNQAVLTILYMTDYFLRFSQSHLSFTHCKLSSSIDLLCTGQYSLYCDKSTDWLTWVLYFQKYPMILQVSSAENFNILKIMFSSLVICMNWFMCWHITLFYCYSISVYKVTKRRVLLWPLYSLFYLIEN